MNKENQNNLEDDTLLKINNLSFRFSNNPGVDNILEQINLDIKEGESLGIIGPNGGGKSTLLKIITGQLRPQSGTIVFKNKTINFNQKSVNYLRNNIGYMPQDFFLNSLIPMSVDEFVSFYNQQVIKSSQKSHKIQTNIDDMINLDSLMEELGLNKVRYELIKNLSAGQRQRVLLARAILSRPSLLILDEPLNGVDSESEDKILKLFNHLKDKFKMAIIHVDHNLNLLVKNSDRILCLNRSHHWHDNSELVTKNVLESIYHCELEHLKIHEHTDNSSHDFCDDHDHIGQSHHHKGESHD
jgi:zinc transport system ATP-binding protein